MTVKEKEITIFSGRHIWKSGMEYYGEKMIDPPEAKLMADLFEDNIYFHYF
jgi:hypothetical protein